MADGMLLPEIWTLLFLPHNSQFIVCQSYCSMLCTCVLWTTDSIIQ